MCASPFTRCRPGEPSPLVTHEEDMSVIGLEGVLPDSEDHAAIDLSGPEPCEDVVDGFQR